MDFQGYNDSHQGDTFTDGLNLPDNQFNTSYEIPAMNENNIWSDNLDFNSNYMSFDQMVPNNFTNFDQTTSFGNQEYSLNDSSIWDGALSFGQGGAQGFDQALNQGDVFQGFDSYQPLLPVDPDWNGFGVYGNGWDDCLPPKRAHIGNAVRPCESPKSITCFSSDMIPCTEGRAESTQHDLRDLAAKHFLSDPPHNDMYFPTTSDVESLGSPKSRLLLSMATNLSESMSTDEPSGKHFKSVVALPTNGKSVKPRLRCDKCKSTFPRQYELRRHQAHVHDHTVNISCNVYGCNRLARPFPRRDKFMEHMRKHNHAHQFLCIVDGCRIGPFTHGQLQTHLDSQHDLARIDQPQFDLVLQALGWRRTPLSDGTVRFDVFNACPLAFLGCQYTGRDPYTIPRNDSELYSHMQSHDLVERSKGYEAMNARGLWISLEQTTCSMCQKPIPDKHWPFWAGFSAHLLEHSKEDRMLHAEEIFQIYRPYLKKGEIWHGSKAHLEKIGQELAEAGIMNSISIINHHSGYVATEITDTLNSQSD